MSAKGRAAHAHNKRRHAQRQFGHTKPVLQERGSDTLWMSEFLSSAQGTTGQFYVNSTICLQLGATEEERITKLRQMSQHGVIRMASMWRDGKFIGYAWRLTDQGRL